MPRLAALGRVLLVAGGLAVAVAVCAELAADPRFALPGAPPAVVAWVRDQPLDALAAIALRCLVVVGSWLLATTVLGGCARVLGAVRAVRLLDRITPALVRRVTSTAVSTVLGVGLAAPMAVAEPRATPTTAVEAPAGGGAGEAPMLQRVSPAARPVEPPPALAEVPPVGAALDRPSPSPPGARLGADARPSAQAPAAEKADTRSWTVRPGDHLWAIAEAVVTAADPDAGDGCVARYWRRLIDVNRSMLVDADNPDLLLPGQVVRLPGP